MTHAPTTTPRRLEHALIAAFALAMAVVIAGLMLLESPAPTRPHRAKPAESTTIPAATPRRTGGGGLMARIEIHLSTECWTVLQRLHAGRQLVARRVFPHPHHFVMSKPEGGNYAKEIAPVTIHELVSRRLVDGRQVDGPDHLAYTLTERGERAALNGALFEDDGACTLFEEPARVT